MIAFLTETRTRVFLFASAALFTATAVAVLIGLRLCLTPSIPLGVYQTIDGAAPVPGVVVMVCLSEPTASLAAKRGYIARGRPLGTDDVCPDGLEPLGKRVLATGGDTVAVADRGLAVNGRAVPRTARLPRDSYGRPLPLYPAGVYVVHAGDLWVIATDSRRSFDSRYFGPLPERNVLAVVRPLLTWERGAILPAFRPEWGNPATRHPESGR
ncbi:MAG TPA: conjugative transfer signal peptidase TraF [Longimicrobium sp.]